MEQRILILAPRGRDASVIAELLATRSYVGQICLDAQALLLGLDAGAAVSILAEETLASFDLEALEAWLRDQPPWSDLPFIVLGTGGRGVRAAAALERLDRLGNVILLERPLHPEGLLRTVSSTLGARRRQYEARARIEQVRDSETKFRGITESMPQIVWSTRPDGHHDFYNERWYAFTGVPHGSTDGEGWNDLFHPDDRERAWTAWRHSLATGEDYDIEYRLRHYDGRYLWVLGRATALRDPSGAIVRWMGTCTEIEEIVEARETLTRSREQLSSLVEARTEDLRSALTSLQSEVADRERAEAQLRQSQKLEAVGQLTGGVAHDFNNLLTIIRSSVDFLRRRNLPQERRDRYVNAISDTVDRAAKLTGQLLAFARRQPLSPEVFDVGGQVETVSELIRPLVGARVRIDIEVADPACFAQADIGQFETALVNLAVNARDAMAGEGRILIRISRVDAVPAIRAQARRPGAFVAVSVQDTGAGIPADKLEQIFEPFFTTKEVGKGTGLGLSQVFGFAQQSEGEIEVTSEPGRGATFTLFLPRVDKLPDRVDRPAPAHQRRSVGKGARVLIVEDNEAVGQFSTEMLQDLGYATTLASNAAEALEMLTENALRFDLVFSDVIMPGMNGVDLARVLRDRYPALPVVLTSGYSTVLAEEGLHGFELVRKPYSVEVLSGVLSKVLTQGVPARRLAGGS